MFSDDILVEILQRLPLKPLFKFKCVCKGWNFFISEPSFKRNYELRSKSVGQTTCGFFCYEREAEEEDDDDDNLLRNIRPAGPTRFLKICDRDDQQMPNSFDSIDKLGYVIASCKGLLLLIREFPKLGMAEDYYVCDPIIRKHHRLPPYLKQHWRVSRGLFCEESGNYKVVIFSNDYDRVDVELLKFETFSSESGQWKESTIISPSRFVSKATITGQMMGDLLYWWEDDLTKLLAYDPNDPKQCVKLIEVPLPGYDENEQIVYHSHYISETKEGYLQYCRSSYFIEIFVLNEPTRSWYTKEEIIGNERWNLIHKIRWDSIHNMFSIGPDNMVASFKFDPLDSQRLFLIPRTMDEVLYSYDYSNEQIDRICSFDFSPHQFYVFYQHPLWPSFC